MGHDQPERRAQLLGRGLDVAGGPSLVYGQQTTRIAAINYRSEPMFKRFSEPADFDWNEIDIKQAASNDQAGGFDPETPIVLASPGLPVRLRLMQPGGMGALPNLTLHGHVWQRQPYTNKGTVIGNNPISEWTGSAGAFAANNQMDIVISQPGGLFGVPGDYLYRDFLAGNFEDGMWSLLQWGQPRRIK